MARKAEATAAIGKTRVQSINAATVQDAREFADYLAGNWTRTVPPRIVKSWEVDVDEECERLAFNGPLLNVKSLKEALERGYGLQSVPNKLWGADELLIFSHKIKGNHPRGSIGVATTESLELSTLLPGPVRKKVFASLADHLVKA
ncbi:MAG: hypothetical protein NTY90_00210 [Candidatus Micrarchaeota archaeon]|nr:hypothetical protein [Candidatus Micrarchaeota archaeon]